MNLRKFRPWPKSLAGRLTVMLVAALAVAQVGLTLMLRNQQDSFVEGLMHSQTLNQTVTLARLINAYPAADDDKLTGAFGSRQACAQVAATAPAPHSMNAAEQELAAALTPMLHGVNGGAPVITIGPVGPREHPCAPPAGPAAHIEAHADNGDRPPGSTGERSRAAAVDVALPLLDGRWLTVKTTVDVPDQFDRTTLISFILSCLAVSAVAIVAVRAQTRSLRKLADASDRFGRGEAVQLLPTNGPAEIVAATRAFNIMQERLSLFMRDRLRLVASVSHDLRTPLTTLRLKAEFIDDDTVRDDVIATIDELTMICEATLAFTRAETTSEKTVVVDLGDLVSEVVEEFRLADKDVATTEIAAVRCACRPVALKRAVRNLVENAVRYGEAARLSIVRQDDSALIRVDDRGPGLPADQMEEAFKPFVRLEPSRSAETGGIGLGLSIARSIVGAHGGRLTLANRPEGGLRAEIDLPLHATDDR